MWLRHFEILPGGRRHFQGQAEGFGDPEGTVLPRQTREPSEEERRIFRWQQGILFYVYKILQLMKWIFENFILNNYFSFSLAELGRRPLLRHRRADRQHPRKGHPPGLPDAEEAERVCARAAQDQGVPRQEAEDRFLN